MPQPSFQTQPAQELTDQPAGWTQLSGNAMSKSDTLRYGPPGEGAIHLCVDMQRIFAEDTEWKMPWLERVLPNIVAITTAHTERTIFTRFIPAKKPGHGVGMWRHYYERWSSMTTYPIFDRPGRQAKSSAFAARRRRTIRRSRKSVAPLRRAEQDARRKDAAHSEGCSRICAGLAEDSAG